MLLFDEFERTFDQPKTELESSFSFLNRTARPAFVKVRTELERWFVNYPESDQGQFSIRLRNEFEPAFYELFLHELLLRMGAIIEIENTLGTKEKRPDFVANFCGNKLILDATVFSDESNESHKERNRIASLFDAINELEAPFFLGVEEVVCHVGKQAAVSRIKAFLTRKLSEINPDNFGEDSREYPVLDFHDENVRMRFRVYPKSKEGRTKKSRLIGMSTLGSKWNTAESGLRKSLEAKGKKYGETGLPFVIGVNTMGAIPMDESDFDNALFGTAQEYVPAGSNEFSTRQLEDGFWGTAAKPKYSRVSGAILGMVLPWNAPRTNLVLYRNPWGKHPLFEIDWPFPIIDIIDGKRKTTRPTRSLGDLFALDFHWPGLSE